MDEKTIAAQGRAARTTAAFEETPWTPQERLASEPDAATAATLLLLSEAARHSFRLPAAAEAGILVKRG